MLVHHLIENKENESNWILWTNVPAEDIAAIEGISRATQSVMYKNCVYFYIDPRYDARTAIENITKQLSGTTEINWPEDQNV